MFHIACAIALTAQSAAEIQEIGEWGRKITEVYMNWYTFFVTANLLVMGWSSVKTFTTTNHCFRSRSFSCL